MLGWCLLSDSGRGGHQRDRGGLGSKTAGWNAAINMEKMDAKAHAKIHVEVREEVQEEAAVENRLQNEKGDEKVNLSDSCDSENRGDFVGCAAKNSGGSPLQELTENLPENLTRRPIFVRGC